MRLFLTAATWRYPSLYQSLVHKVVGYSNVLYEPRKDGVRGWLHFGQPVISSSVSSMMYAK